MTPEEFFADSPLGLRVYDAVGAVLEGYGPSRSGTTTSQVAFRRRRGFAWLWLPGQYLRNPPVHLVLSLMLDHRIDSPRFREVVQPSPNRWQHHLAVSAVEDIDAEVRGWLEDAWEGAG